MSKIIDDYRDSRGSWVRSYTVSGDRSMTRSGTTWLNMVMRCKEGGAEQARTPRYKGCTISPVFSDFQLFTDWHVTQVGYAKEGYQLDKDLLVQGNKVYSEDVCVLVPLSLNSFVLACNATRGELMQGVSWDESRGKFQSHISVAGRRKSLGRFSSEASAYAAL